MRMNFITGAEFNRFPSEAKKKAEDAPVVITERGRKGFVLMSYAAFEELDKEDRSQRTLLDLAHPESAQIDFKIERNASFGRDTDFD